MLLRLASSLTTPRLTLRRIEAEARPLNLASNRLMLRLGFKHEGTLRQRRVAKGADYDACFYGCLADDWQQRRRR